MLSGFLITYLLFAEQKVSKIISIKSFYIRRILRIWPLYILIIPITLLYDLYLHNWQYIHGFFVIKALLFFTFLPNISLIIFSSSGFPTQLWSVSSEEQFYLIWPHLVKRKIINSLKRIIFLVAFFSILRFFFKLLDDAHYSAVFGGVNLYNLIWRFLYFFRIDCMGIGAAIAFLYFNKEKYKHILRFLYRPLIQILNFCLIILILYLEPFLGVFQDTVFACLFATLILNVATNDKSILNLEFFVFNFLGKISYGMYVYHPIILIIMIRFFTKYKLFENNFYHLCFYLFALILTITVSSFSYNYFEKPFLKIKSRYSKIISGVEAKMG